ncbi:MAG: hypothetical protein IIC35_01390 [Gemmatimonadetes bacterium]|nr:hypothetical protein [Gemmatimonadota bacterium]
MRSRPSGADFDSDRARQTRSGRGALRVRLVAAGLSIALHAIGFLMYPSIVRNLRSDADPLSLSTTTRPLRGPVVLRLIDIDVRPDLERPENPEEIEEVAAPEAEAEAPIIEAIPLGGLVPPGPTAAERLRPHLQDARLWTELPPEFYELTMEQREELLLSSRIVEWYDSLALVRAAEDKLTDWTYRDGQGGRWGIADGKIYLGDISIPMPLSFGVPVGKRDETAQRVWVFEEIARQSQRFLLEQTWKERAAAIRIRRDRERAAARPDTTSAR